jgi:hypothetical protein
MKINKKHVYINKKTFYFSIYKIKFKIQSPCGPNIKIKII